MLQIVWTNRGIELIGSMRFEEKFGSVRFLKF